MPQDQHTGAAAGEYGRSTARQIARLIGAQPVSETSNECLLDDVRIVIKCARHNTMSVGVTYTMLDRIERVLGAFETAEGSYELLWLDRDTYRSHMTATRSTTGAAGKMGMVLRQIFYEQAHSLGVVTLSGGP